MPGTPSDLRPTGDYARTLDGELWEVVGPITAERLTLRRRGPDAEERQLTVHELGPVERVTTYAVWRGRPVRVDVVDSEEVVVSTGNPRVAADGPWSGDDHHGWTARAPLHELTGLREAVTWVTRGWPVADPPPDAVSGRCTVDGRPVRRVVSATWQGEPVAVDGRRDDGTVLVTYVRSAQRASELGMTGDRDRGWWRWVPAAEVTDVHVREQDLAGPDLRPPDAPR